MNFDNLDEEYIQLIKDIIDNSEFLKLKTCEHHGVSRFEHSLKVSYNSYKFAKRHNLDYKEVARAGLLHDFFFNKNYGLKQRLVSCFKHPYKALDNACFHFKLNEKEKDIIKSHMFPINGIIPKYKESWVVSTFDKIDALNELTIKLGYKLRYSWNLILVLIFNFIK